MDVTSYLVPFEKEDLAAMLGGRIDLDARIGRIKGRRVTFSFFVDPSSSPEQQREMRDLAARAKARFEQVGAHEVETHERSTATPIEVTHASIEGDVTARRYEVRIAGEAVATVSVHPPGSPGAHGDSLVVEGNTLPQRGQHPASTSTIDTLLTDRDWKKVHVHLERLGAFAPLP